MAKRKTARSAKKAPKRPVARKAATPVRKAAASKSRVTARKPASKPPARKSAPKAVRTAVRKAVQKAARKAVRKAVRKAPGRKTAPVAKKTVITRKVVIRKKAAVATKRAPLPKKANAPKKRSAPAPSPKFVARKPPALDRTRRTVQEDDHIGSTPSSLDMNRTASSARSGGRALRERMHEHTEAGPSLTGGDVDADWESAYAVGDEAPGGDNPTPDQDIVDDIGKALGVQYEDNEELKGEKKISDRDRNRWELDPASAEDYPDHDDD